MLATRKYISSSTPHSQASYKLIPVCSTNQRLPHSPSLQLNTSTADPFARPNASCREALRSQGTRARARISCEPETRMQFSGSVQATAIRGGRIRSNHCLLEAQSIDHLWLFVIQTVYQASSLCLINSDVQMESAQSLHSLHIKPCHTAADSPSQSSRHSPPELSGHSTVKHLSLSCND